jgi:hypothetical protein
MFVIFLFRRILNIIDERNGFFRDGGNSYEYPRMA